MTSTIKINETSLHILAQMMINNEDSAFMACAKHIVKDLDIQIQESNNVSEIIQLQRHYTLVNKMLATYSIEPSIS